MRGGENPKFDKIPAETWATRLVDVPGPQVRGTGGTLKGDKEQGIFEGRFRILRFQAKCAIRQARPSPARRAFEHRSCHKDRKGLCGLLSMQPSFPVW